jgi:hypothetical protein
MPTELIPFSFLEGVEPVTDRTSSSTQHYISSKGIRFKDGFPEKIGGWQSLSFDGHSSIEGTARSIFSYKLDGYTRYLVGTHTNLYDIFGSVLTNITPVKTATIAIANSLDTYYGTLANDPISTTDGSTTITITDTAHKFQAGDTVTLSGSTAVNGIPAGDINATQFIRSVPDANTYTIIVNTAATSTGTGGGASVVRASGIVTVNATAHDLSDGARVKIAGATAFGGILAAEINLEFIIRNSVTNAFDVVTEGTATSSVSGGGGAGTTYQEPIDAGNKDTTSGQGYGVGLYGVGLYGVSKTSTSSDPPRIWSHDRFGDLTISMSNDQSELYSWDGDIEEAPIPVSNAPQGNYCFVSNNIAVVLGASAEENRIQWSDQGGLTNWTTGQSGQDDIEGAGKFLSHASARGENLLFTENQTYRFRYIGGQFIWQTSLLDPSIGLIAQSARVVANGVVYWMGSNNFYMWRGGNVEVIPSNSSPECTALKYVFEDLNFGQKEKIFAWYNPKFREVWWEYNSSNSSDPDRVIRVNIDTFSWCIDELERTAAEYPSILSQTPYLANESGTIYLHENGLNDDGSGLDWNLETSFVYGGTDTVQLSAFIPDHNVTGDVSVQVVTKDYPKSDNKSDKTYTVSPTDDRISCGQNGRYWNYRLSSNALDQQWEGGLWYHEVKKGTPK